MKPSRTPHGISRSLDVDEESRRLLVQSRFVRFVRFVLLRGFVMIVALTVAAVTHASDRTGVYARVDKVVLEPNEQAPQRVQVWGVFAIADSRDPNAYRPPARGYLYYMLPPNAALALREWADLQSVAGTNQIVAFGSRWSKTRTESRVRKADELPASPDVYTTDIGMRKIDAHSGYAPVRSIVDFKP